MKLLIVLALVAGTYAQGFLGGHQFSGKSVHAPQPHLVEMPSHEVHPFPAPAVYGSSSHKSINVGSPIIHVPNRIQPVVDVPHSPIQMPHGGVHHVDVPYDIPQPVITQPPPIIQRKPVIYNVPQPIIQVPQPIIRHRPILYKVPHILELHRPIVNHRLERYNVPSANVQKSGYGGSFGGYNGGSFGGYNGGSFGGYNGGSWGGHQGGHFGGKSGGSFGGYNGGSFGGFGGYGHKG